jgi:hypothetical protein
MISISYNSFGLYGFSMINEEIQKCTRQGRREFDNCGESYFLCLESQGKSVE